MDTRKQILVVDDDLRLRGLVESHLQGFGFGVRGMSDGRQIESLLAEAPVDLIVLDLGLPHEDGLQICRRLRPITPIPWTCMAGRSGFGGRSRNLRPGGRCFIHPP